MNQFEQEVNRLLTEAYKAGIREVVEWVRSSSSGLRFTGDMTLRAWKAKLKEWNLEDE